MHPFVRCEDYEHQKSDNNNNNKKDLDSEMASNENTSVEPFLGLKIFSTPKWENFKELPVDYVWNRNNRFRKPNYKEVVPKMRGLIKCPHEHHSLHINQKSFTSQTSFCEDNAALPSAYEPIAQDSNAQTHQNQELRMSLSLNLRENEAFKEQDNVVARLSSTHNNPERSGINESICSNDLFEISIRTPSLESQPSGTQKTSKKKQTCHARSTKISWFALIILVLAFGSVLCGSFVSKWTQNNSKNSFQINARTEKVVRAQGKIDNNNIKVIKNISGLQNEDHPNVEKNIKNVKRMHWEDLPNKETMRKSVIFNKINLTHFKKSRKCNEEIGEPLTLIDSLPLNSAQDVQTYISGEDLLEDVAQSSLAPNKCYKVIVVMNNFGSKTSSLSDIIRLETSSIKIIAVDSRGAKNKKNQTMRYLPSTQKQSSGKLTNRKDEIDLGYTNPNKRHILQTSFAIPMNTKKIKILTRFDIMGTFRYKSYEFNISSRLRKTEDSKSRRDTEGVYKPKNSKFLGAQPPVGFNSHYIRTNAKTLIYDKDSHHEVNKLNSQLIKSRVKLQSSNTNRSSSRKKASVRNEGLKIRQALTKKYKNNFRRIKGKTDNKNSLGDESNKSEYVEPPNYGPTSIIFEDAMMNRGSLSQHDFSAFLRFKKLTGVSRLPGIRRFNEVDNLEETIFDESPQDTTPKEEQISIDSDLDYIVQEEHTLKVEENVVDSKDHQNPIYLKEKNEENFRSTSSTHYEIKHFSSAQARLSRFSLFIPYYDTSANKEYEAAEAPTSCGELDECEKLKPYDESNYLSMENSIPNLSKKYRVKARNSGQELFMRDNIPEDSYIVEKIRNYRPNIVLGSFEDMDDDKNDEARIQKNDILQNSTIKKESSNTEKKINPMDTTNEIIYGDKVHEKSEFINKNMNPSKDDQVNKKLSSSANILHVLLLVFLSAIVIIIFSICLRKRRYIFGRNSKIKPNIDDSFLATESVLPQMDPRSPRCRVGFPGLLHGEYKVKKILSSRLDSTNKVARKTISPQIKNVSLKRDFILKLVGNRITHCFSRILVNKSGSSTIFVSKAKESFGV